MVFNTAYFAIFFILFFVAYRIFARTKNARLWLIVLGSAWFYGAWDYRFVPLLFGTALLDFFIARKIEDSGNDKSRRKRFLVVSLVVNLGVLGFFKYADFVVRTAYQLKGLFGPVGPAPVMGIILPVGISFYTFQSMSYTIDVYRRHLAARRHPRDFLAAVSFFPHLVAGPIIRATTLLPQFERSEPLSAKQTRAGFMYVAAVLFNKTIADLLAPLSDSLFNAHGPHSALASWTGALAFTGQVYGDFAGYSEIAIGVALLLGFVLPMNFDFPYIASSPVDFWTRWHISLSTWLRDYLYMSLGWRAKPYRNLMITMLLGGLWHGANWTFVVWGGYHGVLVAVTHAFALNGIGAKLPQAFKQVFGVVVTFYLVVIGWVLFRAASFSGALQVIHDMHHSSVVSVVNEKTRLGLLGAVFALPLCHLVSRAPRASFSFRYGPLLFWPLVVTFLIGSILLAEAGKSFIYFQF